MKDIKQINEALINIGILSQYEKVSKFFVREIIFFQVGKYYVCYHEKADILGKLGIGEYSKGNKKTIALFKIQANVAEEALSKILSFGYSVVIVKQLEYGKKTVRQVIGVIEKIEEIVKFDLANIYVKGDIQISNELIYDAQEKGRNNDLSEFDNCIDNYIFCKEILESYIIFVFSNNQYYTFKNDASFIKAHINVSIISNFIRFEKNEFEDNIESILGCSKKVAVVSYETLKEGFHRKIEFIDTIHDVSYMFPNREIKASQIEEKNEVEIVKLEVFETINSDILLKSNIDEETNSDKKYDKMSPRELSKNINEINLEKYFMEHPFGDNELSELFDCIDNRLLMKSSIQLWNIKTLELCIEQVDLELYNEIVGLTNEEVIYLAGKYNINYFISKHPEFWDADYIPKEHKYDINTCNYEEIVQILEEYPANILEFLGTRSAPLPSNIIKEYFDVIPTNYFKSLSMDKVKSYNLEDCQMRYLYRKGATGEKKSDFEIGKKSTNTKIIDPNTRNHDEIRQIFVQDVTNIKEFLNIRTALLPSCIIKEYFDLIPINYFETLSMDKVKSCNLEDDQIEFLYIEGLINEEYLVEHKYLKIIEKYSELDIVEKCKSQKEYDEKMIASMFESDMPQLDALEYSRKIFNDSNLTLEEARSRNCNDYMKKIDGIWY